MVKLAFCGDDCGACPRYIVTHSGDKEQLRQVANIWEKVGWRETIDTSEEIMCHGCTPGIWCRYGIKKCASERDVENCGQCDEYPCGKLSETFEKTQITMERCKELLSEEEFACLYKAFFMKKANLDKANHEYNQEKVK